MMETRPSTSILESKILILQKADELRKGNMHEDPVVIFVCEHGAAKSVIAAAYFNQLAKERRLNRRAVARGTNPDPELSAKTVEGLQRDGMTAAESVLQKLTLMDVESARQIISFCELPEEFLDIANYEKWEDIPAVSENYAKARDMILAKLKAMMK